MATASDYKVWEVDPVSFLIQDASGLFNYWWAGCLMSDKFCSLNELMQPEFVSEMQDLSNSQPTHKFIPRSIEVGGYGEPFSFDCLECVPV
jgi:hypothetical protein